MTNSRSMFTEVIEDHLALKKQNAALEVAMPLARYDVGDPLDRYPGGPVRPAVGVEDDTVSVGATGSMTVPAAGAGEAGDALQVEPLNGMTPMLSLVEDLEETTVTPADTPSPIVNGSAAQTQLIPAGVDGAAPQVSSENGAVVRFPGGAGPRVADDAADASATETTGEQPVLVIDADEPLASTDGMPSEPRSAERKRPSFFGFRRKKKGSGDANGAGWFSDAPRDFDWE